MYIWYGGEWRVKGEKKKKTTKNKQNINKKKTTLKQNKKNINKLNS